MLCLGQSVIGKNVLSLRTGAPVGSVNDIIIDPNNLKIEGWHVQDLFNKRSKIVLSLEVRDILSQGIVVNDHDAMTDPHDLIRLKPILDLHFSLLNLPVFTDHKKRLGKVNDYAFDKDAMIVQKLYVGQPVMKSFSGGTLMIDRSQIVEITNRRIVVREPTVQEKVVSAAPAVA